MKKVLAVLLALVCALSVCVVAFADTPYVPTCDYCGQTFANDADLKVHIDSTFPIYAGEGHAAHEKACGNTCDKDFDGVDECCDKTFTTKAAYEAHKADCAYTDELSNWEKAWGYLKAGNFSLAFKFLGKGIVAYVKSDDFKKVLNKVVDFIKGIDLGGVVSTVKNVAGKIPFDKVKDVIGL